MAKLGTKEISVTDIEEYLAKESDFAFELKVLDKLTNLGYSCQHSGLYEDPVTNKTREFDIRAEKSIGNRRIYLSVECKNVRANYPFVAHCTPRTEVESFHDVLICPTRRPPKDMYSELFSQPASSFNYRFSQRSQHESIYAQGNYVAKSIGQVGRTPNGDLNASDDSIYEKVSQSLHSAYELIEDAHYLKHMEKEVPKQKKEDLAAFILPILVIPDERLWQVNYEPNGARQGIPILSQQVSYFVSKPWRVGYISDSEPRFNNFVWYNLSHLEIVAFSFLEQLLENYFESKTSNVFPPEPFFDLIKDEYFGNR
jgi:hypothetical protein